jgi:hypothetical protein
MKTILALFVLLNYTNPLFAQDTIRIQEKPHVILHGWYPNYKENPALVINENTILFPIIKEFENTLIRNFKTELKSTNDKLIISRTGKVNPDQYSVIIGKTNAKFVEIEVWLQTENKIILIKQNSNWININTIFPTNGNLVLIGKVKLKIKK